MLHRHALLLGCCAIVSSAYSPRQRWIADGSLLRYKADPSYCASVREGKVGDGADIILWHCGKGPEFQWVFEGDYVKLKAKPEMCMSVREGKAGDGSDIILWRCSDDVAFKWKHEDEHLKFLAEPRYFMSVRADKVSDGADLILWLGHSAGYVWQVKEPMIMMKADPRLCIGIRQGGVGDGSDVVLSSCASRKGDWTIKGDLIQLADNSKYCVSVREGIFKDNQDVIIWTCNERDPSFQWIVDISGRIKAKANPHYCLMVREAESGDGFMSHGTTNVRIKNCDAHDEGIELTHSKTFWDKYSHNAMSQAWAYENFQLKSKADARYCATAREGKVANGYGVIMWHCMKDKVRQSEWLIEGNLIKLKQDPSFCMSVREGKGGDGSDVILWKCDKTDRAFLWNIDDNFLTAPHDSKTNHLIGWKEDPKYSLSVRGGQLEDGADLILWSGYGNPFLWDFEDVGAKQVPATVAGLYVVKLKVDPHLCLSVREGKAGDGSDLILWQCDMDNHAFKFQIDGDMLRFGNDPRLCVSVREGKYQDGADLILWTCKPGDQSQQWVVDKENGRIRFKAHKNYCLTVREGRAGDGSNIIMWSCDVSAVEAGDDEL